MFEWSKKNWLCILCLTFGLFLIFYGQGCESRVPSLLDPSRKVTRSVLDLELRQLVDLAALRKISLDRQDRLKRLVAENAIILLEGSPANPLGILTGIFGLYGLGKVTKNVSTVVKNGIARKKAENHVS